jgi:CRISPR-associated protein Csd1
MPCTEKSAARTNGAEAYPLCDKLEYVAADFANYTEGKKLDEKYTAYISLLGKWANSEYSNQKIKSIYNYVKQGTLSKHILKHFNVLEKDASAWLQEKNKGFVRWEINIPNTAENRTWVDPEIQQLWIAYYVKNCPNHKGFCYISGETSVIGELHGQKIRNAGDGTKLISSNDDKNYTFRGRFTDADQACQIGMEVSVKAHNALRWLIKKQGAVIGNGLTIVSWCSTADIQPLLINGPEDYFPLDDIDSDMSDPDIAYSTLENSALAIKIRLRGYFQDIPESDKILIMGMNAATPGRMSILLYREFTKTDFFEAQEYWYKHLEWFCSYIRKEDKKLIRGISTPSLEEIVKTAYGGHLNDNMKASTVQRLLPCIIDKSAIPSDIEGLCFNRASRLGTLDRIEREKTLETACAVIKYNLYARKGKEFTVGLEEDRRDRDYLYGRLLAVADKVERAALEARSEDRESNAVRYMQRFSKYPCSTWKLLYTEKLPPYLKQLNPGLRGWYEGIIQNISDKFIVEEFVSDKALSGEFLLGYHCQQKDFWRKRDKDQAVDSSKNTEEEN